jgi:hypothetical protein
VAVWLRSVSRRGGSSTSGAHQPRHEVALHRTHDGDAPAHLRTSSTFIDQPSPRTCPASETWPPLSA